MNYLKLTFILSFFTTLIIASTPAMAAGEVVNGNACMAANLNQALELKWDHARVENPSTNPYSRFVTCSLGAGPDYLREGANSTLVQFVTVQDGGVQVYFSENAAADSEVSCIFRSMPTGGTTTVATSSKAVVLAAPASLPGVVAGSFVSADNISINAFSSFTVTCKLAPGTGINSVGVSKTLPSSS